MSPDPTFRSQERRRWLAATGWLLLIYLTIPLARTIQEFIRDHGGKVIFLWITFSALGWATFWIMYKLWRHGVHVRGWRLLLLALIGALFAGMTWSLRDNPEESLHFVQYGVLSFLLFRAYQLRLTDPTVYLVAALTGMACGIMDELIQWVVPRRFFDFRDIAINVIAVIMVQFGLAFGWRPSAVVAPVSWRGLALSFRWLVVNLLLILFCLTNTVTLKMRYEAWIPLAKKIPYVTAEYGFRYRDPAIGEFLSRMNPETLRREDAERYAEIVPMLDQVRSDPQYYRFIDRTPAYREPLLVEARVRIFRRDRHAQLSVQAADEATRRDHAMIAYRENQILESYFPNVIAHSRFAWSVDKKNSLAYAVEETPYYRSPVSKGMVTAFSQKTAAMTLGGLILVTLIVERWATRKIRYAAT